MHNDDCSKGYIGIQIGFIRAMKKRYSLFKESVDNFKDPLGK